MQTFKCDVGIVLFMPQSFPPQSFEDIQAYYEFFDLIRQTLSEKERDLFVVILRKLVDAYRGK